MTGHTSGVRLFRSDEADTDQLQGRRRMRSALCAGENMRRDRSRSYQRHPGDSGYGNLLIGAGPGQGLGRRFGAFGRSSAASLVGTAPRAAGHFAGRICRHTGRSRQSDCGPCKDESERQSCRDLAQHLFFLALSGAVVESIGNLMPPHECLQAPPQIFRSCRVSR
jgi:hypothetical protein